MWYKQINSTLIGSAHKLLVYIIYFFIDIHKVFLLILVIMYGWFVYHVYVPIPFIYYYVYVYTSPPKYVVSIISIYTQAHKLMASSVWLLKTNPHSITWLCAMSVLLLGTLLQYYRVFWSRRWWFCVVYTFCICACKHWIRMFDARCHICTLEWSEFVFKVALDLKETRRFCKQMNAVHINKIHNLFYIYYNKYLL